MQTPFQPKVTSDYTIISWSMIDPAFPDCTVTATMEDEIFNVLITDPDYEVSQ